MSPKADAASIIRRAGKSGESVRLGERWTLTLLALGSFLVGLDALVTVPLIPVMATELGFPARAGGLLVTAYAAVYTLAAPIFGALTDEWGRKRSLIAGALVLGFGTLLTGAGASFWSLLLYRAVTGLGASVLEPAIFATIGDRIPYERRGQAMGVVTAGLVVSTIVGIPIATWVAKLCSWRWTLWGIGCSGVLLALVIRMALSPDQGRSTVSDSSAERGALLSGTGPASPSVTGRPGGRFLPRTALRRIATLLRAGIRSAATRSALVAMFCWFAGLQGLHANLGTFYATHFGLVVDQIGHVLLVAGVASVLGSFAGGKIADKAGKVATIKTAGVVAAAGVLAVSALTGHLAATVALHAGWALGFAVGHTALNAWISELNPEARGTVLALNTSAMYGGMMAATGTAALVLRWTDGNFVPVGIVCSMATLAAVFIVTRVGR